MAIDASDVNDGAILANTVKESNEQGQARLKVLLPSGRWLTSDYGNPEQFSTKMMLTWCEAVREQIAADGQEAELKLKRERQMAARGLDKVPEGTLEPGANSDPVYRPATPDPVTLAQTRITELAIRREELIGTLQETEAELAQNSSEAAKWKRILEAFNESV